MSSTASPESTRQQAIPALGEIGNPEDCQTMLNIAADSQGYTQVQAYVAAGAICKEQGVQVLEDLTPSADPTMLGGLAIALKNTSSRAAIPTLISLLKNSDEFVRRDAEDALEMLTHVKSQYGIGDENQAIQAYNEWSLWWSEHGRTAPLYNPYQCVIAKLLS